MCYCFIFTPHIYQIIWWSLVLICDKCPVDMGHDALPYKNSFLTQALNTFPQFKKDISLFVSISKSSLKAFQADWVWAVTMSMHPPACPMMLPRKQLTNSLKFISIYCYVVCKRIINLCNGWAGLTNEILTISQTFQDTKTLFMHPFLAT